MEGTADRSVVFNTGELYPPPKAILVGDGARVFGRPISFLGWHKLERGARSPLETIVSDGRAPG